MFITFDGQHGAGKSYIVDKLYARLIDDGYLAVKTKEPTDSEIGVLARKAENCYTADTLTCLFAADRLQHIEQIKDWLRDGKIVICDRYIISGLILQNMDKVSFDYTMTVNSGILKSDLSIILCANSKLIRERLLEKNITRLAKQEQEEEYDRYIKYREEILRMIDNVFYLTNNTLEEGERIVEFIYSKIKEHENFV